MALLKLFTTRALIALTEYAVIAIRVTIAITARRTIQNVGLYDDKVN